MRESVRAREVGRVSHIRHSSRIMYLFDVFMLNRCMCT